MLRRALTLALGLFVSGPALAKTATMAAPAMVTCKDGTTAKAGRGACSRHGGVTTEAKPTVAAPAPVAKKPIAEKAIEQKGIEGKQIEKKAIEQKTTAKVAGEPAGKAARKAAAPAGKATARCKDGSMSFAKVHTGACSRHGGVAKWL